MLAPPFEGILGNSSALRILEFLLPREDLEFNIQELADQVGVSWPTAHKVIEKYLKWKILKEAQERGNAMYYELNKESPFFILFEDFNNLVIENILPEEILNQIDVYWQLHAPSHEEPERESEPLNERDSDESYAWIQPETQKMPQEGLREKAVVWPSEIAEAPLTGYDIKLDQGLGYNAA